MKYLCGSDTNVDVEFEAVAARPMKRGGGMNKWPWYCIVIVVD